MIKNKQYKDSTAFFILSYFPIIWLIYGIEVGRVFHVFLLLVFIFLMIIAIYPLRIGVDELKKTLVALKARKRNYFVIIIFSLFIFLNILGWVSNVINVIESNYNFSIIALNFIYLVLHLYFVTRLYNSSTQEK